MKFNIGILSSGTGKSVQCICDAVKYNILDARISAIFSNKKRHPGDVYKVGLNYKETFDKETNVHNIFYDKSVFKREEYEMEIINHLKQFNVDLLVLAGFNFIVSQRFIDSFDNVINLHPALYDTFIGWDCARKAYDAYQRNEITHTGSMVHEVIEELDKGKVIRDILVPIYPEDSYEDLESRMKQSEKGILISAIQHYINIHNENIIKKLIEQNTLSKINREM